MEEAIGDIQHTGGYGVETGTAEVHRAQGQVSGVNLLFQYLAIVVEISGDFTEVVMQSYENRADDDISRLGKFSSPECRILNPARSA